MRVHLFLASVFAFANVAISQQPTALKPFLEKRLSDRPDANPPSYDALLRVVNSLEASSAEDIQASLPLLSHALRSNVSNLPVEAVFAFFAIARRPDGAKLLSGNLVEIASLMQHSDERISGGSTTILRELTRSIPDSTVPLLLVQLRSPGAPTLVKSEIVRTLLELPRKADPQILTSVEAFLAQPFEPKVRAATLGALTANRFNTPAISAFALASLSDGNKDVQIAAIQAVYALGQDVRDRARPKISLLASDVAVDEQVRTMAQRALKNELTEPYKVVLPPPPPRKGAL
jgi:hypothetical protein